MEVIEQSLLPWDGSYLGEFKWRNLILDWFPAESVSQYLKPSTIYAVIKWKNNSEIPVVLKLNSNFKIEQCIIDELKDLFNGVRKMGSHILLIDGKLEKTNHHVEGMDSFLTKDILKIKKSNGEWYDEDGNRTCMPYTSKKTYMYFMFKARVDPETLIIIRENSVEKNKNLNDDEVKALRNIYIFNDILGSSDKQGNNILRLENGDLLSISENLFRKMDETARYHGDQLYKNVMKEVGKENLFEVLTGGKEKFMTRVEKVVNRMEKTYKNVPKLKNVDDLSWIIDLIRIRMNQYINQ